MTGSILTKEGVWKTEDELYQEYIGMNHETQCMISFEGFIQLRKNMRYE